MVPNNHPEYGEFEAKSNTPLNPIPQMIRGGSYDEVIGTRSENLLAFWVYRSPSAIGNVVR